MRSSSKTIALPYRLITSVTPFITELPSPLFCTATYNEPL